MKIKVGQYNLGIIKADLFIDNSLKGGTYGCDSHSGMPTITIGIRYCSWELVLGNLMHETLEATMIQMCVRYCVNPDYSEDMSGWLFAMTHPQFSEVVARAGYFVAACLDDFKKAYKKAVAK